jgi:hypothetical protein
VQPDRIAHKAAITPAIACLTTALGTASILSPFPETLAGRDDESLKLWETTPPNDQRSKKIFGTPPLACQSNAVPPAAELHNGYKVHFPFSYLSSYHIAFLSDTPIQSGRLQEFCAH